MLLDVDAARSASRGAAAAPGTSTATMLRPSAGSRTPTMANARACRIHLNRERPDRDLPLPPDIATRAPSHARTRQSSSPRWCRDASGGNLE